MPHDHITWIPAAAQRRVRWKNGAGWTTEIAAHPPDEFDWRLSVAEIDANCDFSRFPGIDRTILAIGGPGFELFVADDPPVHLVPGGRSHAFSGDLPARCEVAGPGRDFNVMTRRGRYTHTLESLDLRDELEVLPDLATTTALYILDGHALVDNREAAPGDGVLLGPGDYPVVSVRGTAALILVRLTSSTGSGGTIN